MVSHAFKFVAPLSVLFLAATFSSADISPELEQLVAKLDADDPLVREAACREISDSQTNLQSLFEVMKRPTLSLEQRKRLEAAARGPFENSPRAGLGVSFDRGVDDGSVRIIGTVDRPGFHAHEVLKPGDTVRELDGIPIRSQEQARSVILSHDPQETIDVLIVRQGTRIRAAIKLGNFMDLDIGGPMNQLRQDFRGRGLDAAFKVRLMRELGDHVQQAASEPVDAGFNSDTWEGIYRRLQHARSRRTERDGRTQVASVPVLNAAGVGRIAAADVVNQNARKFDSRLLPQDREFLIRAIAENKAMQQQQLRLIDLIKNELQKPNIPAQQQQQLREQLAGSQSLVKEIEFEISVLNRQLTGR